MLQQLISHNSDLKRLVDEGYEVEVIGGQYLLAHQIPYLNASRQVRYGTIICITTLAGPTRLAPPANHTVYFKGEKPCNDDGRPISAIIHNSNRKQLSNAIVADHYFSSKPASGNYANYYDKIRTYAEILSVQAQAIDPSVTARPNKQKQI